MNQANDHQRAVALAGRYLHASQFRILERSWTGTGGTADLITADGGVLVIVEVRARTGTRFSSPLETITRARLSQLRTLAAAWMNTSGTRYGQVRIDVIGVLFDGPGGYSLQHIRHVS